jgi:L-lactate permease
MAWTFNGTRIFVQNISESLKQIIARLQPLSGGTVLHIFGYDSEVTKLSGIIVGNTDKAALIVLAKTGTSYTLVSPEGSLGSFYVSSVTFSRIPSICQTLRGDLASNSPLYNVELELYI